MRASAVAAGDPCAFGGFEVEAGLDTDGNGQLDGDETASAITYVWNGAPGVSPQVPADADQCPNGGTVLTVDPQSAIVCRAATG